MKKSKTRYVILGLLTDGDYTGYELKKLIDVRFSFFWSESYGQLYPELKRLEQENLIKRSDQHSEESKNSTSARDIIRYTITETGREELEKWLAEPTEPETVRYELLLKMYFSSMTDEEIMIAHIKAFKDTHEKQLQMLDMFERELAAIRSYENHEDILKVIDFGQKTYNAYLQWSEETIDYLKERKKT